MTAAGNSARPAGTDPGLRLRFVECNGLRLHLAEAGPAGGPLVVLLHGFPEFWYGWRQQIPALAAAGFRVWAPDQRGYNRSDKPASVRDYRLAELAADALGLIEAAGVPQADLIGHDWGAAVAWAAAVRAPERIRRLAVLNVPHPAVMLRRLSGSLRQMLRSLYIGFFQIPRLPEALLAAGGWGGLTSLLVRSGLPGTFGEADLERYRRAWAQPGALTAMLNWYRAAGRYRGEMAALGRVQPACLILWGARDVALGRELARLSLEMCRDGRLVVFEQASHWVQHDAADEVNRQLLAFLQA